jgi:uncharacterized protein HemX
MINTVHARDNGAYAQYQQQQKEQQQQVYVPQHWDPSDGETTATEVGIYAVIIALILGLVLWAAIKKDRKND